MYLDKIVDDLNLTLKDSVLSMQKLQAGKYYGLSKLQQGENDNEPYFIDNRGVQFNISTDDNYPFSIYHRLITSTYKDANLGFGDDNDILIETNKMICVVYCDGEKVGILENDLANLIAFGLNKNFTKQEINDVNVGMITCKAESINYNSKQLFQSEYGNNAEYSFTGKDIYFSLSYSIDIMASKNCLANC